MTRISRSSAQIRYLLVVLLLAFCKDARSASFDCNNAMSLSDKTVCSDPFLSMLDERDATLYQKAIPIDPLPTFDLRKYSLAKKIACGKNVQCLSKAYEDSVCGYLDIINKNTPSMAYEKENNREQENNTIAAQRENLNKLSATKSVNEISPKQIKENVGLLILFLLAAGICSFCITWKIFNFFISLSDAVFLSPFNYYCKKIGAAATVSFASMLLVLYTFFYSQ